MEEKENKEGQATYLNSKYVWVIGGLILLVFGYFAFKILLSPFQEYKVTLVDAPKEASAGGVATFTWRVDGAPTTIHHTEVYTGTVSSPGDLGKDVKPGDTRYTDYVKDFADGNFNIPLQFVGNLKLEKSGKYYFRVHALIDNKNYWSDEMTLNVNPASYTVSLIHAPKEIKAGTVATFTWRVDGPPAVINHTSVHYGLVSTPGTLGADVAPANTTYSDLVKDFASGNYNIPLQFIGNAKIATPGAYFFRAHAVVDGKNYWTDENTLTVTK